MKIAEDYRVSVSGEELPVYDSGQGAFVSLEADGPITLTVTANRDFEHIDIRPIHRGIGHDVDGRSITFTLDGPQQVVIELEGDIKRPLFVFVDPPEENVPSPDDPGVHYFAAGETYDVGCIELAGKETVYIQRGAVVRGSIHAANAKHIRVAGRGILDATDSPGGHLLRFTECEGVVVEGITIFNNPAWNCVPWQCKNVHFLNVKIIAWRSACDGIDVVSSQRVMIENCFIRNEDDCIAIKAHGDDVKDVIVRNCVLWNGGPGNALEIGFDLVAQRISGILFYNCDIIRVEENGVLTIHNGDRAIVEDIHFENVHIDDARDQFIDIRVGLSIWSEDCPDEYRPRFDDPDFVWQGSWLGPADENLPDYADGRGVIRNIFFKNITVHGDRVPDSYLLSYDADHGIANILFYNLQIAGKDIRSLTDGQLHLTIDEWVGTETDSDEVHFAE
jgi:hypothetical protein